MFTILNQNQDDLYSEYWIFYPVLFAGSEVLLIKLLAEKTSKTCNNPGLNLQCQRISDMHTVY